MMSHLEAKNHDGIHTEIEAAEGFISGNKDRKQALSMATGCGVGSRFASEGLPRHR